MKTFVFTVLICALLAFAAAELSTIRVELSSESDSNWIVIAVHNASVQTSSVHIKEAGHHSWSIMDHKEGRWTHRASSSSGARFPLSFMLISVNGDLIVVLDFIHSLEDEHIVDTKKQYPTEEREERAEKKHTTAPTASPSKHGSSSSSSGSSSSGSSGSGCSVAMKLLVPLYTDPGSSWTSVADGAANIHTVAIINPNSGPGTTPPDSSYNTGMTTLHDAGVELVGYVHTSYGARAMADVKADIAQYAAEYPLLVGIFIDECATSSSEISYYTEVYEYIVSFPGWKYDIINPGSVPNSGYLAVSTQIVAFEDEASNFASSENPSFASCSNANNFAMIAYAASSTSTMESALNAAKSKGYYGWAYVTDGASGGETYNNLASYYSTETSYFKSTIN